MRKANYFFFTVFVLCVIAMPSINAGIDIGLKIDDEGVKSFHLAVSKHYNVSDNAIQLTRKRNISDDELPVVFYLAYKANVAPLVIIKLRNSGKSWFSIAQKYGFNAGLFYVPVKKSYGPPYGKAYGYYKNRGKHEWHTIRLADKDVVNLVNLRFLSDHHGYSPDEIMEMRSNGKGFQDINKVVKLKKKNNKKSQASNKPGKDKNKSKGKGKNK